MLHASTTNTQYLTPLRGATPVAQAVGKMFGWSGLELPAPGAAERSRANCLDIAALRQGSKNAHFMIAPDEVRPSTTP